jgi:hypothetical protein
MTSHGNDCVRSTALALLLALALPWAAAGEGPEREPEAPPRGTAAPRLAEDGAGRPAAGKEKPFRGWQESFSAAAEVQVAGEYQGAVRWNLESFSALCLEPSTSARFSARRARGGDGRRIIEASKAGGGLGAVTSQLVFDDPAPALLQNAPGEHHFYKRAEGTISALGWVDELFRDVVVTGAVNTSGGRNGAGSVSRQGLMARWDRSNNFYWFYVDFAVGEFAVLRGRYFGLLQTLEGSVGTIPGFARTKSYDLEFALVGDTVRGKVFDPALGQLVGDTGWITDSDPWFEGVSGFLAEPALKEAWTPLEGSFAKVSSRALGPQPESAPSAAELAATPKGQEATAKALAEYEQAVRLRRAGKVEEALDHYYAALRLKPDLVPAMKDVAWIRATSAAPELREPKEAVFLAEKALDIVIEAYNRRREAPADASSADGLSKLELVRLGNTLAAALASDGVFTTENAAVGFNGERFIEQAPIGATSEQVVEAASDSEYTICAQSAAEWTLAFARNEQRKNPGAETEALVAQTARLLEMYERERAPYGEPQP